MSITAIHAILPDWALPMTLTIVGASTSHLAHAILWTSVVVTFKDEVVMDSAAAAAADGYTLATVDLHLLMVLVVGALILMMGLLIEMVGRETPEVVPGTKEVGAPAGADVAPSAALSPLSEAAKVVVVAVLAASGCCSFSHLTALANAVAVALHGIAVAVMGLLVLVLFALVIAGCCLAEDEEVVVKDVVVVKERLLAPSPSPRALLVNEGLGELDGARDYKLRVIVPLSEEKEKAQVSVCVDAVECLEPEEGQDGDGFVLVER